MIATAIMSLALLEPVGVTRSGADPQWDDRSRWERLSNGYDYPGPFFGACRVEDPEIESKIVELLSDEATEYWAWYELNANCEKKFQR